MKIMKLNDNQIISASFDETIKIWEISIGECIKTLTEQPYFSLVILNNDKIITLNIEII
jgi:hypothetical protein